MNIKIDNNKLGQLTWRTCFSSVSFYGYKLDILKSGLQKYLRRREETKMLWCLGEIYLFHIFAKTQQEKRSARGIITNLLNRIIIMMDEELLFAEWNKYLLCRSLIERFEKSKRDDFIALINVCKILCSSKLLRLNSDIRGYFDRGMRYWGVPKPKEHITNLVEVNSGFGFMKGCGCQTLKKLSLLRQPDDDEGILLNMANFIYYFDKKDPKCFYWVFEIFNKSKSGLIKNSRRFRRTDGEYIIWEYLFQQSKGNKYLMKYLHYKLEEYFVKNRGERSIWLTGSIMAVMHKENIDWCSDKMKYDMEEMTKTTNVEIFKIFEGRKKLEIDDYAIDMHCSLGRKMGKNKVDFIKEGSVVVDEDKEYFVQEWRDMYNGGKIQSVKKKIIYKKNDSQKSSSTRAKKANRIRKMRGKPNFNALEASLLLVDESEFDPDKIRLCLATTCGNKAMCFEYGGFIWKEGRETMNYNRDYICVDNCKLIFGLTSINMMRILSNFTIQKIDKTKKYWKDNWQKVVSEKQIVYCRMRKIGNSEELIKYKKKVKTERVTLTELLKIAIFRGIFRVSDFNLKNVLVDGVNLVSIDEGDIGKRVGIIGGRNKWLIKEINKKAGLYKSVLADINSNKVEKLDFIKREMKVFKFSPELIQEVEDNWKNLEKDLQSEGLGD